MLKSVIWLGLLCAAVSVAPAEAAVFGLKSGTGPNSGSGAPTRLFTFEEDGSSFADLGTVTVGGGAVDADALALSQNHGMLAFQVGIGGSRLISLGGGSPAASVVGSVLTGRDIRGAVFDLNDRLWVVDAAADELLQIDPTTGAVLGSPLSLSTGGGTFDIHDGSDLAIRNDGSIMLVNFNVGFDLNVATGVLSSVFTHPFPTYTEPGTAASPFYTGAAFSQNAGAFDLFTYEANGTDDIYVIDGASGYGPRATLFPHIISSFNSGRGDLATLMPALGVPAPGALALLGFGLMGLGLRKNKMRRRI